MPVLLGPLREDALDPFQNSHPTRTSDGRACYHRELWNQPCDVTPRSPPIDQNINWAFLKHGIYVRQGTPLLAVRDFKLVMVKCGAVRG